MPTDPSEDLTFEEAIHRLESLVESMETGEAGLEEALRAYEEGVVLARYCLQRLESAELRVQELALDG